MVDSHFKSPRDVVRFAVDPWGPARGAKAKGTLYMKVGIIGGAGGVGSAIAFYLATRNVVDEIAVIDVKENLATAHSMDMGQAICDLSPAAVTAGGLDALEACDIAVLAASGLLPKVPVMPAGRPVTVRLMALLRPLTFAKVTTSLVGTSKLSSLLITTVV